MPAYKIAKELGIPEGTTAKILTQEGVTLVGGAGAAVLAIGGVLLMVGWNKRSTKAAKMPERIAAWQKKVDLQERGWICHRCGHTWIPV